MEVNFKFLKRVSNSSAYKGVMSSSVCSYSLWNKLMVMKPIKETMFDPKQSFME